MRDPDGLLARAGVRGDPRRDQHFLVDDRVLNRLPGYATDAGADLGHVLEIGAGTGALTDRLLAVADRVTAVERDPELAAFLREEFADAVERSSTSNRTASRSDNAVERSSTSNQNASPSDTGVDAGDLAVIEGDALEVELPEFTACVSNLPYGISSEILFRLLPLDRPLVVMVQQEFGERMAAEPGTPEYGRLSVSAQHYADVEIVETVPREAFDPQPRVESVVVRTHPREPEYEVDDDEFFLRFVKAVFTQRRKTLRNAVRNTAHISGLEDPDAVVDAAGDDRMSQRPGELSPAAFADLAALATEHGRRTDDG